jgi:hypothetical protein
MRFLWLALFSRIYPRAGTATRDPLLVFGRAPLFFYILHVHLLSGSAWALGLWQAGGLSATFAASAAVLAVLYPLCRWYAKVKGAHPGSILRFI